LRGRTLRTRKPWRGSTLGVTRTFAGIAAICKAIGSVNRRTAATSSATPNSAAPVLIEKSTARSFTP
jgi:hypothetical protein